jgi:hypothetical protein
LGRPADSRAKCAVIEFGDFAAGAAQSATLPDLGAFSQPTVLMHARDAQAKAAVEGALSSASRPWLCAPRPWSTGPVDAEGFWMAGYAQSYKAEAQVEVRAAPEACAATGAVRALLRPALTLPACPSTRRASAGSKRA